MLVDALLMLAGPSRWALIARFGFGVQDLGLTLALTFILS